MENRSLLYSETVSRMTSRTLPSPDDSNAGLVLAVRWKSASAIKISICDSVNEAGIFCYLYSDYLTCFKPLCLRDNLNNW